MSLRDGDVGEEHPALARRALPQKCDLLGVV
jgi:hypothetical protein